MAQRFMHEGFGKVPSPAPNVRTRRKHFVESHLDLGYRNYWKLDSQLRFATEGMPSEEVDQFLNKLMSLDDATEPIVQSGSIYGVSKQFDKLNSGLLMFELQNSSFFRALPDKEQDRAVKTFGLFLNNPDLRNRNPIHPSVIDACLISKLLDFLKSLLGFPYASYATDGNESLSLVLFAYKERAVKRRKVRTPTVIRVGDTPSAILLQIGERLNIKVVHMTAAEVLKAKRQAFREIIAIVLDPEQTELEAVAKVAASFSIGVHLHISDYQWNNIFRENERPVHFIFPSGITSASMGGRPSLRCGYSFYKDYLLRDFHLDLPENWQSVYLSPNEGGSNSARYLFMDLCRLLLGWTVLRTLALNLKNFQPDKYIISPSIYTKQDIVLQHQDVENILHASCERILSRQSIPRDLLETQLARFQMEFLGGAGRELDVLTTCGGTRSITMVFEAVITKERNNNNFGPYKVLTGNPHFAVERAERRLGFELQRICRNGSICLQLLKENIRDPSVIAVYAQSLSYTDGTSDPINEIYYIIEEANKRRERPIVLLNDCCLAFNVLLHNDGKNGLPNMRLLDISNGGMTPCIVINDPHKHLGTDKGISTIIGTKGSLESMRGRIRVGALPTKSDLIQAIADVMLIGRDGYFKLYRDLSRVIVSAIDELQKAGAKIINYENRRQGSTVIAVEDTSGAVSRLLKRKGHKVMLLVRIRPDCRKQCQTGWQLSITLHHLRDTGEDKTALRKFLDDYREVQEEVQKIRRISVSKALFRENSVAGSIVSGNIGPYILGNLFREKGMSRGMSRFVVRRVFSTTMDSYYPKSSDKQA